MAEWQLPKLHTRVRFPSPAPLRTQRKAGPSDRPFAFARALLGASLLACGACASLPQRSRWTPPAAPLANLESEWERTDEAMADGVRIKAMNNRRDLHLLFAMDDPVLQGEFSGQYGQSVLLWFGEGAQGRGLRIDYAPGAKANLLVDPLANMVRSVTLLGPPSEGYPRAWAEGSEGIEVTTLMASGTLVYELRLPLQSAQDQGFALGARPGDKLPFSLEAPSLVRPVDLAPDSALPADAGGAAPAAAPGPQGAAPLQGPDPFGHGAGMRSRSRERGGEAVSRPGTAGAYATQMTLQLALPPPGQ